MAAANPSLSQESPDIFMTKAKIQLFVFFTTFDTQNNLQPVLMDTFVFWGLNIDAWITLVTVAGIVIHLFF